MGRGDEVDAGRVLVERARRGDPDAWEALYRAAYPSLRSFARRRTMSDALAEDAISEAMSRAIAGIGRYRDGEGGVQAWLHGILRNVLREQARRDGRTSPGPAAEREDAAPGPADVAVRTDEAARVRAALALLPEADRELLELRFTAGLDAPGIAAVLGRRPGAVRMAQSRALARLRGLLEEAT